MTLSDTLSRPGPRAGLQGSRAGSSARPLLACIFLLMVVSPLSFWLGSMYFTSVRFYVFLLMIPAFMMWVSGKAGRIIAPDILLVLYVLWMFLSLLKNNGMSQFVYGGSQAVEIFGSYLIARVSIRSREDFLVFCRFFIGLVIVLLPFAAFEAVTGDQPLRDIFRGIPFFRVNSSVNYGERMGLIRSQVTFGHPIHFGMFCATAFSLALIAMSAAGQSLTQRVTRSLAVFGSTFFSLSSGALAVLMGQFALIGWNVLMRNEKAIWKKFTALSATIYLFLHLASNRGPIILLISYATFSSGTAWYRVAIWTFGSAEVWRHPIFGMGKFDDWTRPFWMVTPSVDNHWLLMAMRYGFPGIALLLAMFFWTSIKIGRLDLSARPDLAAIRKAFTFTIIGLFVGLSTVTAFGALQQFVFFFVGIAGWMLAFEQDLESGADAPPAPQKTGSWSRYTRFPRPSTVTASAPSESKAPRIPDEAEGNFIRRQHAYRREKRPR